MQLASMGRQGRQMHNKQWTLFDIAASLFPWARDKTGLACNTQGCGQQ